MLPEGTYSMEVLNGQPEGNRRLPDVEVVGGVRWVEAHFDPVIVPAGLFFRLDVWTDEWSSGLPRAWRGLCEGDESTPCEHSFMMCDGVACLQPVPDADGVGVPLGPLVFEFLEDPCS